MATLDSADGESADVTGLTGQPHHSLAFNYVQFLEVRVNKENRIKTSRPRI